MTASCELAKLESVPTLRIDGSRLQSQRRPKRDLSESADSFVARAVALPPRLLLQVVITLGDRTSEGRIIESVEAFWLEIARLMQRDPSVIYQIDDRMWEEIIAGAYTKAGFEEVILTPRSGDYGRDVIAVNRSTTDSTASPFKERKRRRPSGVAIGFRFTIMFRPSARDVVEEFDRDTPQH